MGKSRPTVLTIAGYDPSGGAGIIADIKTFEQLKVYGYSVITANTIQDADQFDSVNWMDEVLVLKQLEFLLKKHAFEYVKIGLIQNAEQINKVLALLHQFNPKVKVVWDPILSSSTGFNFHQDKEFQLDLDKVFLLTPNLMEFEKLKINSSSRVYLKGGHSEDELGVDRLLIGDKKFQFKPKRTDVKEKHGSGCILSSAIVAYLAKGYPLNKACLRAKDYVTKSLASNPSKLAFHKL